MERKYWNLRLPIHRETQLNGNHATSSSQSASKDTPHSLGNSVEWEQRRATVIGKLRTALVSAACAVPMVFGVAPAFATAFGIAYWSPIRIEGIPIPIPGGQLGGGIYGEGLNVTGYQGSFFSAGQVCNWRIALHFKDLSDNTYLNVEPNPVEGPCTGHGQQTWQVPEEVRSLIVPGRGCVTLYTAGSHKLAEVCHHIHR